MRLNTIPDEVVLVGTARAPDIDMHLDAPKDDFPPHHSPRFRSDERSLNLGIRKLVNLSLTI